MPRGGKRPGSGPKKKLKIVESLPLLKKSLALKLQADELTEVRWKMLRNVGGTVPSVAASRLRFDVERYIWDRAEGRPVQQVKVSNPKDEKFKVEVDVTGALDKLTSKLLG